MIKMDAIVVEKIMAGAGVQEWTLSMDIKRGKCPD